MLAKLENGKAIVTGCKDCPFSYENDMAVGYGCNADSMTRTLEEYLLPSREIKQDKLFFPITPEWCPLKKESITIQMIEE